MVGRLEKLLLLLVGFVQIYVWWLVGGCQEIEHRVYVAGMIFCSPYLINMFSVD